MVCSSSASGLPRLLNNVRRSKDLVRRDAPAPLSKCDVDDGESLCWILENCVILISLVERVGR